MNISLMSRRTSCRLCNGKNLNLVLPMKQSPIADAYVLPEQKDEKQPLFPLDLYQCEKCGHAQNLDIVNPDLLFGNYIYTTSSSMGLVKHFEAYSKNVLESYDIPQNSLAVEIGSNDGTLLKCIKKAGMRVIGVDPAREIASKATAEGVLTFPEFFTSNLAETILAENGPAKLVLANNVYAHSDSLQDITKGVETLLDHDGVFVFEVSYLLDIIDHYLFDTIYHEHLSYHSITPFISFFESFGLELFDVQKISTKGGSMRCFVQKSQGPKKRSSRIDEILSLEKERGLHQPQIFQAYAKRVQERKEELGAFLKQAQADKKSIVGYGASTTVTTLIYQFELENCLDFLVDDNVTKQGRLSPGAHIEVKPSTALYDFKPDIVLILAWQYSKPIISRHTQFLEKNGTFVIPLPNLEIISHQTTVNSL